MANFTTMLKDGGSKSGTATNPPSMNLLHAGNRIATPFIRIDIGKYTFGLDYDDEVKKYTLSYKMNSFPNFVQSLQIEKINGTVNKYTLKIIYPVTQNSDPNFFEKVFSSVSDTRKIVFSYGDMSAPNYIYRKEEAIITKIDTGVDTKGSKLTYTVSATSTSMLSLSGYYTFKEYNNKKPSDVIKELLYSSKYHLIEIFPGMKDKDIAYSLIASDDAEVDILPKANISILDYIKYLVSNMIPVGNKKNKTKQSSVYSLALEDSSEGQKFKVIKVNSGSKMDDLQTYTVDVGYPGSTVVKRFDITDTQNYSILYNWSDDLNESTYVKRINNKGEMENVYAPSIAVNNESRVCTATEKTWWTKMTEFPIRAKLELKGLLKPSILMTNLKVNVWFYGRKHVSSGYYIITAQTDTIDNTGFNTSLTLLKVSGDDEIL